VWGALLIAAGRDAVLGQLWGHVTRFADTRALPYPSARATLDAWPTCAPSPACVEATVGLWLQFLLPPVVVVAVVARLGLERWRSGAWPAGAAAVAALGLVGAGLYAKALTRFDAIHALPALLVVLVAVAWLTSPGGDPRRRRAPGVLLAAGAALAVGVLPGLALARAVRAHPPIGCHSRWPVAACVPLWDAQEDLLPFLARTVPAAAPVFVGLQRHDRVLANDISLYFLAGRPVPTRHHELDPGVADTHATQSAIRDELERSAVDWVVLVDYPLPLEPNASGRSSGVRVLDDHLRRRFDVVQRVGRYEVRRRRVPAVADTAGALGPSARSEAH
jgi:hypothetical protein